MATEATRAAVNAWLEATGRGDIEAAMAVLDDAAVWRNIGSTRFSGAFAGKQAIMQQLIGPLFVELENGIRSETEAVLADGDRAVVLSRGTARTKSGQDYNNTYAQVFTVADGKVVAVVEYMDTALVDAVFGVA